MAKRYTPGDTPVAATPEARNAAKGGVFERHEGRDGNVIKYTRVSVDAPKAPTLVESLADLDRIGKHAQEEGLDPPNDIASTNARDLLLAMHDILPGIYDVCPEEDGAVTLSAPAAQGTALTVECDGTGAVQCIVVLPARLRKATYSDAQGQPDGFIREALEAVRP